MHPTNNFCRTFGTRAELIALTDLREHVANGAALATIFKQDATPDQLDVAYDAIERCYGVGMVCALKNMRGERLRAIRLARAMMFNRNASSDLLTAACDTLTHYGDRGDAARAEMLRARIRRDLRAAAAPLTQGGAA